jgi:hypothetical protein
MWLRNTFLSHPTAFLTCKRTISSCLHATEEIVDGPKSYHVVVLCVDYQSYLIVTCGYEALFYIIPLLSLLVRELYHLVSMPQKKLWTDKIPIRWMHWAESSNSYMWSRSTFLSYTTNFLTCKRTISSCLHAIVEIVDGPKSYQVDVLCVDYPSHLTVTCGYE